MDIASDEITKADILVSQLQRQGKSEFHGLVKGITVRLPVNQFAAIEALSRLSGMSKNKVLVELLDVAVDTAVQGLDRANRKAFNQHQVDAITELADQGYGETARNDL